MRTATVGGGTAALTGDAAAPGPLEVWAPGATTLTWNGARVGALTGAVGASLTGTVPGPAAVSLPALTWRTQDDTAEADPAFDDSSWTRAGSGLAVDPYGFHHGNVWYRGHFTGTGAETPVSLTALTGVSGAYAAWLNGVYLGSGRGGADATTTRRRPASARSASPRRGRSRPA